MIKFSLICCNHHSFEGWFSSSDDYNSQKKRNLVRCPICDTASVEKGLMAPAVSTSRDKSSALVETPPEDKAIVTANTQIEDQQKAIVKQMRIMRNQLKANAEDVGDKFADEARKIHYGETQKRGIYGQASHNEVSGLIEEGVEVLPLPQLPEDKN